MVATVGSISIDLSTNVAKFSSGFRAGATTVERESARMGKAAAGAEGRLLALGRAATGFLGGGLAARQIAQYADSWTSAGNQIRAAGEIAGIQGRSLEAINDIAGETRSGFRETVNLYARLLRAGKDVAKNEQEIATATEIVNKAFKAGGAAASEQAAGILQLGQALGSGILAGDELRSLRENAPLLAQAIADEFGTTIGGLKDLGAAGVLTSERVFQAILKGQKKIDAAFAQTKATLQDSISQLGNASIEAVGKFEKSTGIIASLTKDIRDLSAAIDEYGSNPNLDNFFKLFFIKVEEGGAVDQLRDAINAISEEFKRTTDEVEADASKIRAEIASIEAKIFDLIQLGGEFDLLNAEKLAEDAAFMKKELASLEAEAVSVANSIRAAFAQQFRESENKSMESILKAAADLPGVKRYGEEKPSDARRKETNGVGVTRFESTLEEDTMRTAEATEKLADNMPSWLDDLGGEFDASIRSVNELLASGVFFDYASIADAVRVGIVSGMAQERQTYSISTTNPIQKQINELNEMLEVAGTAAAKAIREQIRALELELYLSKRGRDLGGIGGQNVAYAGKFAEGGSFVVPGAPSGDKTRVALDANGGEVVTVTPAGENAKPTVIINQTYQPAQGETERTSRQNMRNMTIEAFREVGRI